MARRKQVDLLRSAVEMHSGQCRGLAIALRNDAESRRANGRTARLIDGWATQLEEIADGLIEALRDSDDNSGKALSIAATGIAMAVAAAAGFVGGAGEGVGQNLTDSWFSDPERIVECALPVETTGREVQQHLGMTFFRRYPLGIATTGGVSGSSVPDVLTVSEAEARETLRARRPAKGSTDDR